MLASAFVVAGYNSLKNPEAMAAKAKPVAAKVTETAERVAPQVPVPQDEKNLIRINGAAKILGGLALATGRMPRISSALLASTLVPTTAAEHRFWEESDPAARADQRAHFFKNLSLFGGLVIAAADTAGKPGVAWRTKHAVGDARREARHLGKSAKSQARLAAKSVTS